MNAQNRHLVTVEAPGFNPVIGRDGVHGASAPVRRHRG